MNDETSIGDDEQPSTDDQHETPASDAVGDPTASTAASSAPDSADSATVVNAEAKPPTGDEPADTTAAADAAVASLLVDSALGEEVPQPVTEAVAADPATAPEEESVVARVPGTNVLKRYNFRFATFYGALAGILVAALVSFVIFVIRPGAKPAPAWSTWSPPAGTTAAIATAIADHVGAQYRLNKTGAELVAVVPGPPEVNSGTSKVVISEVAISKTPNSETDMSVVPASGTWTFQFCGLQTSGGSCSIPGTATIARGRLVRREALEVALYTFKYDPSITAMIAYMPPPSGQSASSLLYFQASNFAQQLREPLDKTLPRATPPLPTQSDAAEQPTIDKLTLPDVFSYSLDPLDDGSAALLLEPIAA